MNLVCISLRHVSLDAKRDQVPPSTCQLLYTRRLPVSIMQDSSTAPQTAASKVIILLNRQLSEAIPTKVGFIAEVLYSSALFLVY